jgi:hypothetical protein
MNPIHTPESTLPRPPARVPLTSTEFTDRVMVVLADSPAPSPTRSFMAALRERAPRNAARSLSVASHLATVRSWPVAPSVRARSFGLVLGVVFVLATGSLAAAAAVHEVVPLWLGGPGAIEPGGPGGVPPSTLRRPAAPTPPSVRASSVPVTVDVPPRGHDAAKPATSTGAADGDQARHRGDAEPEADGGGSGGSAADDPSDHQDHDDGASSGSGSGSDGAGAERDQADPDPSQATDDGNDHSGDDGSDHRDDREPGASGGPGDSADGGG